MRLTVAALDAVRHSLVPLLDQPLVGLAERGERTGERADEADLDGAAVARAAAARVVAAAAAGGQHAAEPAGGAQGEARDAGRLEKVATRERRPHDRLRGFGCLLLRTHTASLCGPSASPPSRGDAGGTGPPDGLLVLDLLERLFVSLLPQP